MNAKRLATSATIVAFVVAAVLPLILSPFWVDTTTKWLPLAVAALGLNLLTGYNGQISVGHSAFYGLGAYTVAILVTDQNWGYLPALVAAAAVSFVAGVVVGLPALRIKGLYLALVTLAVATLFPQLVEQFSSLTKGSTGFRLVTTSVNRRGAVVESNIAFDPPSWTGLSSRQWTYYYMFAITVACFVVVRNIVKSRVGRSMVAIRDNEIAAEVNGVNVAAVKVWTFGTSAALAGIGGGMIALVSRQASPGAFTIAASIYFLVAVVVGGPATIVGPAVGAVVYGLFNDWVSPKLPDSLRNGALPLVFGVLLIGLMFVAPGGILGLLRRLTARFDRGMPVSDG